MFFNKSLGFDCIKFCQNGFKKTFPVFVETNPEKVAKWLYETVSAFSTRDGRCICGGGEDDIKALISTASCSELPIMSPTRKIKNSLSRKLRAAWLANDHATILYVARGFERSASMAVVDYQDIDWINSHEFLDELKIPEAVEEWIETLCEPSDKRCIVGNHSRSKVRRKQVEKNTKSLFGETFSV